VAGWQEARGWRGVLLFLCDVLLTHWLPDLLAVVAWYGVYTWYVTSVSHLTRRTHRHMVPALGLGPWAGQGRAGITLIPAWVIGVLALVEAMGRAWLR
jgi:hypothetical protein